MIRSLSIYFFMFVFAGLGAIAQPAEEEVLGNEQEAESTTVEETEVKTQPEAYVIPIQGQIGSPTLYIIRRGVKEAIELGIDVIILDINTPGGELGSTLEIMEILDKFEGDTIAYVNNEAISAGAFISITTDYIYFSPGAQIGAAEVVSGTGEEIPEGMKRKIQSYLNAKIRTYTEEYRYRGGVMRAMTDPDYELVIEGEVFSEEGDLLSLTAKEAITPYGDPPENLLGVAIVDSVESLLEGRFGEDVYAVKNFEVSWSEELAQFMQGIVPILLAVGGLLLFIEFKTPSFGLIGGVGIALIVIVFASNYVAGLAGHEALIIFFVGVALLVIEIFIFPGAIIFGLLGLLAVAGSLVWSMTDIWPEYGGGFTIDWSSVMNSFMMVVYGFLGALVLILVAMKVLPATGLSRRIMHMESSPNPDGTQSIALNATGNKGLPDLGATGVVITDLHPIGSVEVDGGRFEAAVENGELYRGDRVKVVGRRSFSLLVEKIEEGES